MNISQLNEGLNQAFHREGHRIVFWYDPDRDFEAELDDLELGDINILNMQHESFLGIKLKLELEDSTGKYLLYFPLEEPEIEVDWLLDIKLYSRSFYADRISIIFNDLGLTQHSLRDHLSKREKFFSSKARMTALHKWIQPNFNEVAIDMAMIAVLVKAEDHTLSQILFAIAQETADKDSGLEHNPNSIEDLEKYELLSTFISSLSTQLSYPATEAELLGEQKFAFGSFLIRLLITAFCENAGVVPDWASQLVMPSAKAPVRAITSRWQDSSTYYRAFDKISAWISDALRVEDKLSDFELDSLVQMATFEAVEKQIIVAISDAIPQAETRELHKFEEIISHRLDSYWASRHKVDDTRKRYRTIYTALSAAIKLFSLRHIHNTGFHYTSCEEFISAYEVELYQFDMAYRHYSEASQRAHVNILKALDDTVEHCYAYWFMDNLAKNWGDLLTKEDRLSNWHLTTMPNQYNFYRNSVEPLLDKAKNKRVMVIISDAFRYEAAVELKERINEKRYSRATLSTQLGVVPSYTTLGMASLLPHKIMEYRDSSNEDVVFIDGQSTQSTVSRNKILSSHQGMAITSETLIGWSKDQGRDALKDQQLIYVFHNIVDITGDSASSEARTFSAVEDAIEELSELVKKVLMQFNTSTVIVTADHGFLFQQSKLEEIDRTNLAEKPTNVIKSKKRYVIGHSLSQPKDALYGSTKNTANTESDTKFWVPKGANRFHFVGGARFVHGGVMPQEIVVPVLTAVSLRGDEAKKRTKRKVGVISAKSTLKMVNNIQSFDLLQTDAVSEKTLPITISVGIYSGDQLVSSEEVITFDSESDKMNERVKKIRLSLAGSDYDRKKDYFLVLKDKDLNTPLERYKVTIDLAFTDDFF